MGKHDDAEKNLADGSLRTLKGHRRTVQSLGRHGLDHFGWGHARG